MYLLNFLIACWVVFCIEYIRTKCFRTPPPSICTILIVSILMIIVMLFELEYTNTLERRFTQKSVDGIKMLLEDSDDFSTEDVDIITEALSTMPQCDGGCTKTTEQEEGKWQCVG